MLDALRLTDLLLCGARLPGSQAPAQRSVRRLKYAEAGEKIGFLPALPSSSFLDGTADLKELAARQAVGVPPCQRRQRSATEKDADPYRVGYFRFEAGRGSVVAGDPDRVELGLLAGC